MSSSNYDAMEKSMDSKMSELSGDSSEKQKVSFIQLEKGGE